jgi:glycosyltransferase involved in cell wall biosynthesis
VQGVLISHPHVASFAELAARALDDAGRLVVFDTGIAFSAGSIAGRLALAASARYPIARNRIVATKRLRSHIAVEALARVAGRISHDRTSRLSLYNALFTFHDAAVALRPWPTGVTTVYAYEDGALLTFRRAQRMGLDRVWDLPLPHYLTIEELLDEERRRWPEAVSGPAHVEPPWKRRRKDEELRLATRVVTASAFTKKSLERFQSPVPIDVIPYAFPVDAFQPRAAAPSGPFRVLSVGTHDLRKGTPYLLEAWKRAAIPGAELHLVGPLRLSKSFVDRYAGWFRHTPHLAKRELADLYATADLLAFPTLGDGFGLVIQEAMCSGTPVVTTPCGGGPECITDGQDGWLVAPRDIDGLAERFRACAADRDACARSGRAARARAERWTWVEAGRALVAALGD